MSKAIFYFLSGGKLCEIIRIMLKAFFFKVGRAWGVWRVLAKKMWFGACARKKGYTLGVGGEALACMPCFSLG
jgi:hypothetical protein